MGKFRKDKFTERDSSRSTPRFERKSFSGGFSGRDSDRGSDFSRGSDSGRSRGFNDRVRSGPRDFGSRDRRGERRFEGRPEFFKVDCAKCGRESEVPFKPTGSRPVYCSDCFRKVDHVESRSVESRSGPSELSEINRKLDLIMKALKID